MIQALHTLDPEKVAAALQNVIPSVEGLTPLAVGGHATLLQVHRRGAVSPLVVKVVPVSDRVTLQRELQYLTYVRNHGISCPEPVVSGLIFTSTIACMVRSYVEGLEAKTPSETGVVGLEVATLHILPLPEFAIQRSAMGVPLASRGIAPEEMKDLLVEDPWQLADQLVLEELPSGLIHGDFMPNNALVSQSVAQFWILGTRGETVLGSTGRGTVSLFPLLTLLQTQHYYVNRSWRGTQPCSHSTTCWVGIYLS